MTVWLTGCERRYQTDMTHAEWAHVLLLVSVLGWMRGRCGSPDVHCHRALTASTTSTQPGEQDAPKAASPSGTSRLTSRNSHISCLTWWGSVRTRRSRCWSQRGDNPERLDSEASFAALCGVSPVERSSGRRQFRRLNRGGDRQANAALHRIVFTRLRVDPRTQDYYERRIQEGKTRREIVRCLKRYAAREVFHLVKQLQPDPRS